MITIIRSVWNDISSGKHIETYLTIIINLVGAILSLFDRISPQVLGTVMLASVTWLVINVFSERKNNTHRAVELIEYIDKIEPQTRASTFFVESYTNHSASFYEAFENANTLDVLGLGQVRMVIQHGKKIKHILKSGGRVRFILQDPEGEAVRMAVQRSSYPHQEVDTIRAEHWATLNRLRQFASDPDCIGTLEVKFIDTLLYTMYGFDLEDPDKACAFIWITPFREPSTGRPGFKLTKTRDPYWTESFIRQFETMWACEIVKPYNLH